MTTPVEMFKRCVDLRIELQVCGEPPSLRIAFPPGRRNVQVLRSILDLESDLVCLLNLPAKTIRTEQGRIIFWAADDAARDALIAAGADPQDVFSAGVDELLRLFEQHGENQRVL